MRCGIDRCGGLEHAHDFRRFISRAGSAASETKTFAELYPAAPTGRLDRGARDGWWREQWEMAPLSTVFAVAV